MIIRKITAVLLAITAFSYICTSRAFAADEASAAVPVVLTVSNNYRTFSVTVPASFPVNITNGTVITADNAKITNNNKYGSVKVTSVTVKDGSYKIGNYDNFGGKQTIALKLNGISSVSAGKLNITDTAFPVIQPQNSLPVKYYAKVSGDASAMQNREIAQVIFTIALAD